MLLQPRPATSPVASHTGRGTLGKEDHAMFITKKMPSERWTPKPTQETGNTRERKRLNTKTIPSQSHTGQGTLGDEIS